MSDSKFVLDYLILSLMKREVWNLKLYGRKRCKNCLQHNFSYFLVVGSCLFVVAFATIVHLLCDSGGVIRYDVFLYKGI